MGKKDRKVGKGPNAFSSFSKKQDAKNETSLPKLDKGKSKISDELRQAVKDLGGDDSDLELIAGVDEDGEDEWTGNAGKSSEKDVKQALKEFMKGLDFGNVPAEEGTEDSEGEIDAESSNDDEDVEEEEEQDDEIDHPEGEEAEEEEEEEEEQESVEKEKPRAPVKAPAAPEKPKKVATDEQVDRSPTSGSTVPAAPSWPSLVPPLPTPSAPLKPLPASKLNTLRQLANHLLDTLTPLNKSSSSSDAAFISQILQSGTHQDKLAALILLVRESPVHAVKELNRLRAMAGWKEGAIGVGGGNNDQRVAVLKALADWWITGGGKESGKLKYFADQPLLAHLQISDRHLLLYAFEDYLKKWYFNILQVIEVSSHDTLSFVRMQALHIIFQLLQGNAEQEQNLLRLGVNKLGDSDKSVASRASYHILQLLQIHPNMRAVVAREVSTLVLKPSPGAGSTPSSSAHVRFDDDKKKKDKKPSKTETTSHARYYGLITLNQMTLTNKDKEVANRLVQLYFEIFREILGDSMNKGHDSDVEIGDDQLGQEQVEKVAGKVEKWRGRRKGAKPKGGRKSAMENEELVETGEAKLVAAVLTGINRALPFASLDEDSFTQYMDSLFKITHSGTFNTSIQALALIFQICQSRQTVSDRFYRTLYDSLFDPRLITASKQAMYLNLLFKALKADTSVSRVMAFVKRLLQMLTLHQPPFICGALYLLGELFSTTPGLRRMLVEPEDDEEHFVDVDAGPSDASTNPARPSMTSYDGKKREPQFAHAETSCLWELLPFIDHFHPSVSLQATQLLNSQALTGSPDISLNTLVSFLDRFVYRNPKKNLQPKGASIMQPAAASDKSGQVVMHKGARNAEMGYVNDEKFWRKKIEDVPVDQLFFHKYFSSKLNKESKKPRKRVESDEEDEHDLEAAPEMSDDEDDNDEQVGEGSELDEDEVWKAMQASMPDAGEMSLSEDSDDDEEEDVSDVGSLDGESEEDDDMENSEGDAESEDGEEEESEDDDENEDEDDSEEGSMKKSSVVIGKRDKKQKISRLPSPDSDEFDFPSVEDEDDLISLDDSDIVDMSESEEDDDSSDDEMPNITLDPGSDEEVGKKGKRKRANGNEAERKRGRVEEESTKVEVEGQKGKERKERRKKRKELPTFASYEDYAAMIDGAASEED
ncbi:ribosome biogenesis protein MAK21 [Tremella mesenterica]|uniref:Ribosome biogenesis protein MAK21 n=1 Tax=Tremella mesenterica TaxID=5217 RepID=A0A4Q1BJT2_TREME|nr:ribosome biogenesis protein MAK21 [Tremella mesenterica]